MYTPTSINDIIFHSVTEKQLIMDIASGAMKFPLAGKNGILLYGIYGTGKTTLARLLPDAIEQGKGGTESYYEYIRCQQGMNGAALMTKLSNIAKLFSPTYSHYHYFVLDEVDNLTDAALASLKSAMNMPQTIFIMTTNNIGNINAGVVSRSHSINCNAAPPQEWLPLARRVIDDCGGRQVPDAALLPIIDACKGCVRDIVSSMQKLAAAQGRRAATVPAPKSTIA